MSAKNHSEGSRQGISPREWILLGLVLAVAVGLWWRVQPPAERSEATMGQEVIGSVLSLPRPEIVEGPHPHQPFPYPPGSVTGISSEEDLIHYQRRYVDFVNQWNLLWDAVGQTVSPEAFVTRMADESRLAHAVPLHELFWSQFKPGGEEGLVDQALVDAALEAPSDDVPAHALHADGWYLVVWDIETAQLRCAFLEGREARGAWDCVPVVAVDLYHHARAVDFPGEPVAHFHQIWPQIQPARVGERLDWLFDLHAAAGGEPTELTTPMTMMTAEEIAASNARVLERVVSSLSSGETNEPDAVITEQIPMEALARWLAWSPGWAVLAWEPHTGSPVVMSVESLEAGAVWGAIPLVAVAREDRPVNLDEAREAVGQLPWREINERVAALRAVGPFAGRD